MASKFVIKPYQQHATMNKEGAEETWKSLDSAITQIHQQNASSLSFEELYRWPRNQPCMGLRAARERGWAPSLGDPLRGGRRVRVPPEGQSLTLAASSLQESV